MDEIKSLTLEFLPNSQDPWMVLSWGLVVDDGLGAMYKVKIVLNRLTDFDAGTPAPYDFRLRKEQIGITVNLGILRVYDLVTLL